MCGTESHLNESILNSEVFPTNYHVYRKDRNIHGGGGVFILVKSSIPSSQVKCNTSIELIWVRIHNNTDNIIIGSFYCPPHSPITVLDELAQSISDIRTMYPSAKIIIGGDFNSPGINWSNKSLITSYISRQFHETLITLEDEFMLEQIITQPTRGTNILDLCFTSHPDLSQGFTIVPGLSDHDAVIVTFVSKLYLQNQLPRKVLMYKKVNWDAIRQSVASLSEEYFNLNETQPRNVSENWQYIHSHLLRVIENSIPTKLSSTRFHLPWLTVSLKHLIRKKQCVYNKAKLYQCPTVWQQFKDLQHQVRSLLCKQHWQYLSNIFTTTDEKTNKPLWRYIKCRRHDKVGIGTLHTPNNTPVIHPGKKAQLLNEQFKSVFTSEDLEHIPSKEPSPYPSMSEITITTPGVQKLLSEINPHKAHGPDNIPARVLKEIASVLAPMLAHLFQPISKYR